MADKNEANVRKYRVLSPIYDWFARLGRHDEYA